MANKRIYTKNFKLKCIDMHLLKNVSISKSARMHKIPRQTLTRWIKAYSVDGEKGLENKKPGVKESPVDLEQENQILQLWQEKKRSKYKMRKDMKIKDINISEWQIQKIYKKNKLIY